MVRTSILISSFIYLLMKCLQNAWFFYLLSALPEGLGHARPYRSLSQYLRAPGQSAPQTNSCFTIYEKAKRYLKTFDRALGRVVARRPQLRSAAKVWFMKFDSCRHNFFVFLLKVAVSSGEVEMWGDGKQTRSFCLVDDCVEGILVFIFLFMSL